MVKTQNHSQKLYGTNDSNLRPFSFRETALTTEHVRFVVYETLKRRVRVRSGILGSGQWAYYADNAIIYTKQ